MIKNKLKQEIDTELGKLEITDTLKERIIEKTINKKYFGKKYIIYFLVVCFVVFLSLGVLGKASWFQKLEKLLAGSYKLEVLQLVEQKHTKKNMQIQAIDFNLFDRKGKETCTYFLKPDEFNLTLKHAKDVTISNLGIAHNQLILLFYYQANTYCKKDVTCSFVKENGQKNIL